MSKKRKRAQSTPSRPRKLLKPCAADGSHNLSASLLDLYYPKVQSLKDFFLTQLPATSRVRRRRIETLATGDVSTLLNSTLVGILTEPSLEVQKSRAAELVAFTQTQRGLPDNDSGKTQSCSSEEVVEFVIWSLFRSTTLTFGKTRHLLCHGLQRASAPREEARAAAATLAVPGITQIQPNEALSTLRSEVWSKMLALLGADGHRMFSSLLLDCGLFLRLSTGKANYYHLSGIPLSDLSLLQPRQPVLTVVSRQTFLRRLTDIRFVRNRILYSKSSLNGKGQVHFGLKHVHVLERYHRHKDALETTHVMKHIFPRQFGLHNVFTSLVDTKQTSQTLPDYTYREDEIDQNREHPKYWVPKRLRHGPRTMVESIRKAHSRCSYTQLLRHYCSVSRTRPSLGMQGSTHPTSTDRNTASLVTQAILSGEAVGSAAVPNYETRTTTSFLPHCTATADVAAFCKSVMKRLLPKSALGEGIEQQHNWRILLRGVDKFVHARKFETLTLHQIVEQIKVKSMRWLALPESEVTRNLAKSELSKRIELLQEFVYYIFDSLLIPVIRSNFYVTESAPLKNKLLYFRHDVWRKLSTPSLAMLRVDLYQMLKPRALRQVLSRKSLGYSHVRLLPKAQGARVITNLRRKLVKSVNGRRSLGSSINAQLAPLFSALNYERARAPQNLGSALFSVGEINSRLEAFKCRLPSGSRLYFVKVDVQSCFDTIPQAQLVELIQNLVSHSSYKTGKLIKVKLADKTLQRRQKFVSVAHPSETGALFSKDLAEDMLKTKQGVFISDTGNTKDWHRRQLLQLLQNHVQNNIVKIGKKHLRQKTGIPQGSVLSSLLCSYFYGAFESEHLGFLMDETSLLLRLIDDFLLMTTDAKVARRFAETMMHGHPAYGITTNAEKSLANFNLCVGTKRVPQHTAVETFPYCGMHINTRTLEIRKDRGINASEIKNSLTVDTTRSPGAVFVRKMTAALLIQLQPVLLHGRLNPRERIIASLLEAFTEVAMKMHQYLKTMTPDRRLPQSLLICAIEELIRYTSRLVKGKGASSFENLSRKQLCWIASASMGQVLLRKQSQYAEVMIWLKALRKNSESSMGASHSVIERMLEDCQRVFKDYVY